MLQQKGYILMYQLDNEKAGFTWRRDFTLPYESLWGIIEKFRYFNALGNLNCKNIPIRYKPGNYTEINSTGYIYYYNVLYDTQELCNFFKVNYSNHFKPLEKLMGNNLSQIFYSKVHICPKCIRYGYHSYFHQLNFENGYCFKHTTEKLIETKTPYYITYSEPAPYMNDAIIHKHLLPSDKILCELINDRKFKIPNMQNWGNRINNLKIYDFNEEGTSKRDSSLKRLRNGVYSLINNKKLNDGQEIFSISIEKAKEKWKRYNYEDSFYDTANEIRFGWFANYCYSYAKQLCGICEEEKIKKTNSSFGSSLMANYFHESNPDYDPDSIGTILTIAKITGYSTTAEKTDIFSTRWLRRYYYMFLENQFRRMIKNCTEVYRKTLLLELYKLIIKDVHYIILTNAYAGRFNQKTFLQINLDNILLPDYILVEEKEVLKIIRIP